MEAESGPAVEFWHPISAAEMAWWDLVWLGLGDLTAEHCGIMTQDLVG
jgi:hypothetical protein